ncbi:porin [Paraburkholderia sp. 22B1P]|uniref:porin n=1 Tax=Paraburkholderia sp. 22B1P TaxID=3080498 RepID=UPI003087376B|nr:porin [Paraburkholderia sp. 22B1P]
MKKSILVMSLVALSVGTAHAQSSVTIYGIIDEGFDFTSNTTKSSPAGGRQWQLDSNFGLNGSRWGFNGSENLGSGLKAVFRLENGFNLNTGALAQGGAEFGRQAYVGLSSDKFGTVLLGRQYDSIVDYLGAIEARDQWGGSHAAHPGDLDNFNNNRRTNNAVKYTSPNFGGVTFSGMYSLGGVPGDFTGNQVYSVGTGYSYGPVSVAAAYLNAKTPRVSFFGNNPNETPTSNGLTSNPIYSGYNTAGSYSVIGVGASYTIGSATLTSTYSNVAFSNISALANASAIFNTADISLRYRVNPALLVGVAYSYTHGSHVNATVGGATYNQVDLGATYSLSKRTDLYAVAAYQHASGHDSTGHESVASIAVTTAASSNENQFVGRVGIRHRF